MSNLNLMAVTSFQIELPKATKAIDCRSFERTVFMVTCASAGGYIFSYPITTVHELLCAKCEEPGRSIPT